jgi:hypothetical protein
VAVSKDGSVMQAAPRVRGRRGWLAPPGTLVGICVLVPVGLYVDHVVTETQWVSQAVPGPMGANDLLGITCSRRAECIIQANNNQILGTPDGGSSW